MSNIINSAGLFLVFVMSFWTASLHSAVLSCSISTSEGLSLVDRCVTITSEGTVKVFTEVLKKMKFNKDGLAEVAIHTQGCFWMNRQGIARKTHCFDNGSDYFLDGLARYIAPNGKFGFMNKNLKIVIPPDFDFIFPFEDGKAKFCQGCKSVQQGEHKSMTGGTWGEIDKRGTIVAPKASPIQKKEITR